MYREFHILDHIDKNTAVTQRQLSDALETAVSLINNDLETIEQQGYIKKDYIHQTKVKYTLTKKGLERKRYLDLTYYSSSQKLYDHAKDNLKRFMESLIDKGFLKLLLYGAGEVSQIILTCINEQLTPLTVVGIIEDDPDKHQSKGVPILDLDQALDLEHDGILIASYTYRDVMIDKLLKQDYSLDRIIHYFT